jgi:hypothetical protein
MQLSATCAFTEKLKVQLRFLRKTAEPLSSGVDVPGLEGKGDSCRFVSLPSWSSDTAVSVGRSGVAAEGAQRVHGYPIFDDA